MSHSPAHGAGKNAASFQSPFTFADIGGDTARMLSLAARLVDPATGADRLTYEKHLAEFIAEYRAWILFERGMADNREVWVERYSILLHLMISGATLGEAMAILVRFAKPVWGAVTRFELLDEGRAVALVLEEPLKENAEGLVSTLWLLSSIICQLEFLVGCPLDSAAGFVRHRRSIPVSLEKFLFGRPLEYQSVISAVRISKLDTQRAVRADTTLIPAFLADFMRLGIRGQRSDNLSQLVADMIWRRLNGQESVVCDMPWVAQSLGVSASMLRRQLGREGSTFKAIKAGVVNRRAQLWLAQTDFTIEHIAECVGYSDAFAFRRAFARANGCSPTAFRKANQTS